MTDVADDLYKAIKVAVDSGIALFDPAGGYFKMILRQPFCRDLDQAMERYEKERIKP